MDVDAPALLGLFDGQGDRDHGRQVEDLVGLGRQFADQVGVGDVAAHEVEIAAPHQVLDVALPPRDQAVQDRNVPAVPKQ